MQSPHNIVFQAVVGWRKHISREVSGSLPGINLGLANTQSQSAPKLKLANHNRIATSRPQELPEGATLTPIGKTVQATAGAARKVADAPRLLAHGAVIAMVGAVVFAGSAGHSARLNPYSDQVGYASMMDRAAAVDVAAQVATQTDLLITTEVKTDAKALNSQVNLVSSSDGTLAKSQQVDTAGNASRGVITYSVKDGDTLSSIAAQFNITSDTVKWANGISDDTVKPGQTLSILPISGLQYKVAAGDTADSLAGKYQSNADQIVAFNNAEVNGLQVGATIIIPDGVMPEAPKPAAAAAPAAPAAPVASSASKRFVGGPNGYAYGYCTYYVAGRRGVPGGWGNAVSWYGSAIASGYSVGSAPRPGAIAWTGAGYYGHVAYVESVSGGMVTVSEMNYNGNWNRVTTRTVPASSFRYIY